MSRAFLAKCHCHGATCQCDMPDGQSFTVDIAGAEPSRVEIYLNPAEADALRASADFNITNAEQENKMPTIFEHINASSMPDERKNVLTREVRNLHAVASRMQLRIGADGLVDTHDLSAALKRTYPRPDQVEQRIAVKQRFLAHGLVTERAA